MLADVVPAADQKALMRKVLEDGAHAGDVLLSSSICSRAHQGWPAERYLDELAPWRTMLDLGSRRGPKRQSRHDGLARLERAPSLDLLTTSRGSRRPSRALGEYGCGPRW